MYFENGQMVNDNQKSNKYRSLLTAYFVRVDVLPDKIGGKNEPEFMIDEK